MNYALELFLTAAAVIFTIVIVSEVISKVFFNRKTTEEKEV